MKRVRLGISLSLALSLFPLGLRAAPDRSRPIQRVLAFEPNRGQTAPDVVYVARLAGGARLFLTPREAVVALPGDPRSAVALRFLAGGSPPCLAGERGLGEKRSYFLGRDPARWVSGIPTFGAVRYEDLYPGVDLVFREAAGELELDLHLAPGADPSGIELAIDGSGTTTLMPSGELVLETGAGAVTLRRPLAFQTVAGSPREIPVRLELRNGGLRFEVGEHDRAKPLLIDPVIAFSSYLGGSGDDAAAGIAVDGGGRITVMGQTASADFPLSGSLQPYRGDRDIFVTRYGPAGSSVLWSTYLGGTGEDYVLDNLMPHLAGGLAIDGSGSVYITGGTYSTDFPVAGALQPASAGFSDAFVAKLSAAGALVYSTYLGGNYTDTPRAIAVDLQGRAYVAGHTTSTNFPATPGAFQTTPSTPGAALEAFVARLDETGGALSYATYLGGTGNEHATGIAADSSGFAYVTGMTTSSDFPILSAFQPVKSVNWDGFVSKLDAAGAGLVYSTFLGGSSDDTPHGIAVDLSGQAYVTGYTISPTFPTTPNAYRQSMSGGDIFVSKLGANGSSLAYSTFMGGSSTDEAYAIAVTASGEATVSGWTYSIFPTSFPLVNAFQGVSGGGNDDAFLFRLSASGSSLVYSSLLGGNGYELAEAVAVDTLGNAYVAGSTTSTNLTTTGATQATPGGGTEAFVMKVTAQHRPGDADASGTLDVGDLLYLVSYLYAGGPAPALGDVNGDLRVDLADVFYLVHHLYAGGPAPR